MRRCGQNVRMTKLKSAAVATGLGVGVPLIGWASDLLAPEFGPHALGVALAAVVPIAAAAAIVGHLWLIRAAIRTSAAS